MRSGKRWHRSNDLPRDRRLRTAQALGRVAIAMELCTLALLAALGGVIAASTALQAFADLLLYFAIGAALPATAEADGSYPAASILARNLLVFGAVLCFLGEGAQRGVAVDQQASLGMLIAVAIT
jgi:hypothetical protein